MASFFILRSGDHAIHRFFIFGFLWVMSAWFARWTLADYPIRPVPLTSVRLENPFWASRIGRNYEGTIPLPIHPCDPTGWVDNFMIAIGLKAGKFQTGFPFADTDLYKILEGASDSLHMFSHLVFEAMIDTLIVSIARAQEPEGYLYTPRTITPDFPHPWARSKRWDPYGSHGLYNCGCLYEADVTHFEVTGKGTLLDVALTNADLLCHVFSADRLRHESGRPIVEMGLIRFDQADGWNDFRHFLLVRSVVFFRSPGTARSARKGPVVLVCLLSHQRLSIYSLDSWECRCDSLRPCLCPSFCPKQGSIPLNGKDLQIIQETNYPRDGKSVFGFIQKSPPDDPNWEKIKWGGKLG